MRLPTQSSNFMRCETINVMVVGISLSKRVVLALVTTLLVSMTLFAPLCDSMRGWPDMIHGSRIIDIANLNPDQEAPIMRYYLRKYYSESPWNPAPNASITITSPNYTVRIFVEDPDGISTVIAECALNDGIFHNITMTGDSAGWYQGTLLGGNISGADLQYSYYVMYFANDSLGCWSNTSMCVYTFQHSTATADWGSMGLYDTPDLWYVAGTIGHTITWEEINFIPSTYTLSQYRGSESSVILSGEFGLQYALLQDDYLIEYWHWSGKLKIGVDGLDVGNHVFELRLQSLPLISDMVIVHVVATSEEIPQGVSTISVEPITESGDEILNFMTPIIILGLSLAAIIVIWKKRRT
jgi:hypothetical protein